MYICICIGMLGTIDFYYYRSIILSSVIFTAPKITTSCLYFPSVGGRAPAAAATASPSAAGAGAGRARRPRAGAAVRARRHRRRVGAQRRNRQPGGRLARDAELGARRDGLAERPDGRHGPGRRPRRSQPPLRGEARRRPRSAGWGAGRGEGSKLVVTGVKGLMVGDMLYVMSYCLQLSQRRLPIFSFQCVCCPMTQPVLFYPPNGAS